MNHKAYWIIRKGFLSFVFKIKVLLYKSYNAIAISKEYNSLRFLIIKTVIMGVIKSSIAAILLFVIDHYILRIKGSPMVNGPVFISVIIGCIGIAGVILGLYCSNMASIYTKRYANAPETITIAYQSDNLTRRCISTIINYIIFGMAVIVEVLLGMQIGWITVGGFVIWLVIVLISYSIAGNRTYQLSDVYNLSNDSFRALHRIISSALTLQGFAIDANFQNSFYKNAEKHVGLLKDIQAYVSNTALGDSSSIVKFMGKNLGLIEEYWNIKRSIGKNSLWFRNEGKYKKWHLTGDTETTIALRTGIPLGYNQEHNTMWFEEDLFGINRACLEDLIKKHDYSALINYIQVFDSLCYSAVNNKELDTYVQHAGWIRKQIVGYTPEDDATSEEKSSYAGVVEMISLVYMELILSVNKYYQEYDLPGLCEKIIKDIDSGKRINRSSLLRGRKYTEFFEKIIDEVIVEGVRITPDWIIKQCIAKEEYEYLNVSLDIISEGINDILDLGELFLDNNRLIEACILITRFYEYESKLARLLLIVTEKEKEYKQYHIENTTKWGDSGINTIKDTVSKWKKRIPELLSKCSSRFVLTYWEQNDDYPDFLGECYNHICEDTVDAITKNDLKQFEVDYECLSKLMILYQEYIRTDFQRKQDLYRIEYIFYMITSPIVEWAQLGGLAILWGEFHHCQEWKEVVVKDTQQIFEKNGDTGTSKFAEKIVGYIQHRDSFIIGVGNRSLVETGWNMYVANAIKNTVQYELEEFEFPFIHILKTDSALLSAFCSDFDEMGFTQDPEEVFWVLCVNPLVPPEKQFHSRSNWESKLK
ncbi:MAG: hypothetical protein IKE94_10525 [Aeriscardovia sp.]|nr:hypothetical protein [Aeriscardovia sp.]